MKVVALDAKFKMRPDYIENQRKIFEGAGIEYVVCDCKTGEDIVAAAKDADGIVNVMIKMDADTVRQLEKCKVVVRCGIGYDVIDVDACTKKGIAACNVSDYCFPEVATHAMAMLLSLYRKLDHYTACVKKGVWNKEKGFTPHRLDQVTLGIVSFGNISKQLSQYAKAFGMKMISYDPYVPDSVFAQYGVEKVDFDELLARSDMISLHAPLTPETKGMINKESIAKMKDGVIIVNNARGPLVVEEDLAEALKSGKVVGAGLDVFAQEPINPDNPLLGLDNVILTPHAAYDSVEASWDLFEKVALTILKVLGGEYPNNVLNRKALGK